MTITVGTDTYITLADARDYANDFANSQLPQNDVEAEKILKQAAVALDRIYGARYLGRKSTSSQPMYWPRTFDTGMEDYSDGFMVKDSDGNPADLSNYPVQLGYAQVELALLSLSGTSVYTQPAPAIISESKKLDVLEKQLQYANSNGYKEDYLYKVSLILRPLLKRSGSVLMTRGA